MRYLCSFLFLIVSSSVSAESITLKRVWQTPSTLHTSESVAVDRENRKIYVSNMGNEPGDKKDGDGFLSVVDFDGKITQRVLVDGLNAPKGIALIQNKLIVGDIDEVVVVDLNSHQIAKNAIEGASFFNGMCRDKNGVIYFSDSTTGIIHQYSQSKFSHYYDGNLESTNGVACQSDGSIAAISWGTGLLSIIGKNGKLINEIHTEILHADGVQEVPNGWLISRWEGQVYFVSKSGDKKILIDTEEKNIQAADIKIIESEKLLLVPTFGGNSVVAYNIEPILDVN